MSGPTTPAPPRNRVRALWHEGRAAIGVIATIPSVPLVRILARAGLDWMLVDLEHGPIDASAAHAMLAAAAGTPLVGMARVTETSTQAAKLPLDLGAWGICFPMISTRADAERAVRAVRYPPAGERFWGPFHAPYLWNLSHREYQDRADEEVLCIATIEHVDALDDLEAIVAVSGLDAAVIGSGDLATSMGLKGRADHPDVLAVIAEMEAIIRDGGIVLGGAAPDPATANGMIRRGYRMIAVGFDWMLVERGLAVSLAGIER